MRVSLDDAVALFEHDVMPGLRSQAGYLGVYALTTPEGKAMLVTFWQTAEAADASGGTGWYPATLEEYTTLFRVPPGREHYEVRLADAPHAAPAG